ncbi:30S ribosomal protein S20 [Candidatus Aerophobetes bacterium]|nr:30S ribosomal protein S20 [Candidatus Aerophobetes bacterium]
MPITKSAKKRMRQSLIRKKRNRRMKNTVKNSIKKFLQLVNEEKGEEAKKMLPQVIKLIDITSSKGVWHKNKAAREKSKLMKKYQRLSVAK